MTDHAAATIAIQTLHDIVDVRPFIPHRGDMQWLDRIVYVDAERVHAQSTLRADSLFVRDGAAPIWVCIEHMAQTVAAWAGNQSQQREQPAKIGYLLGTRRFQALQTQLASGDVLDIHAQLELQADNGLGMFTCEVSIQDRVVAKANLSVFQPPDMAS